MTTPQSSTCGAAQVTEPKMVPGKAWYRGKPLRRLQSLVGAVVHHHPHRNLFVTAMPKSGSTWLARMLASIPGYREWIPTYITETDHTLRPDSLRRPPLG